MRKLFRERPVITVLACTMFVYLLVSWYWFRLPLMRVLPLIISICVMFLQANVNRYAFLLGGLNSLLYAVAYCSMTLYPSAAYAVLFSFPLQIVTFFNWQRNTKDSETQTRSLSLKGRVLLGGAMLLSWIVLCLVFSVLGSKYLIWDNTTSVLGIVASILCMLRYSEYTVFQILGSMISIMMFGAMLKEEPSQIVWLIYTVYATICCVSALIKMSIAQKKQRQTEA